MKQHEAEEVCKQLNHKMRMKIAIMKALEQKGYDKAFLDNLIDHTYRAELEPLIESLICEKPLIYTAFNAQCGWVQEKLLNGNLHSSIEFAYKMNKKEACEVYLQGLFRGGDFNRYQIYLNGELLERNFYICNVMGSAALSGVNPFTVNGGEKLMFTEYEADCMLKTLKVDGLQVRRKL